MSLKHILLLFASILVCTSCYEDVEGCLDLNASNYDLDADISCTNSCCTYPQLSIVATHTYGEAALRTDSFYLDAADQRFSIKKLSYYWSDIQMQTADEEYIEPNNPIAVNILQLSGDSTAATINSNLALIKSSENETHNLGTYRLTPTISGLRFLIGVENDYQSVSPASVAGNHPLAFQEEQLYYGFETGYAQFQLSYDIIINNDTISKTLTAFGNQPLDLRLAVPHTPTPGSNTSVNVDVDVSQLLQSLDLNASPAELTTYLTNRIPNIFSLSVM